MVILSLFVRHAAASVAATTGAVLLLCGVPSPCAEESRLDIPERYRRQVAPTPSTYWRSPDLRDYTRVLKSTDAPLIDPSKRYELPELIDLAQRVNPETRVTWEAARRAALAVGLVESEYFPVLAISALGGYQSLGVAVPKTVASDGFFRLDLARAVPALNLRWLLMDFGRRGSAWDAAKERLLAANLGFNRKHQQIAFGVQRAFYGLTSVRARIAAAQSSLDAARAVQEATESRLKNGLATRPELALARQQSAQAAFELEEVLDRERDAQVTLTESIGASPQAPIQVRAYPGERPVLQGLLWLHSASSWALNGLNVTGKAGNLQTWHLVKFTNGTGWSFLNAEVWGANSLAGILVATTTAGEPANWRIAGNAIHDIRTQPAIGINTDHCIYVNSGDTPGGVIEHNLLYNATNGEGVKLGGSSASQIGPANVIVRYNTIYNTGQSILVAWSAKNNRLYGNLMQKVGTNCGCIRGYQLTGTGNVATANAGYGARLLLLNDAGYVGVQNGGGNLFPLDPQFDTIGPGGFHPLDLAAQAYGCYYPY